MMQIAPRHIANARATLSDAASCEVVVKSVTIPAAGKIPHWSVMVRGDAGNVIAADIVGKHDGVGDLRKRNGAAVAHLNGSSSRDDYSGIGVFRDRHNNLIWVTMAESRQLVAMQEHGLWGRGTKRYYNSVNDRIDRAADPLVIPLPRYCGSSSVDANVGILTGAREVNDTFGVFAGCGDPNNKVGELFSFFGQDNQTWINSKEVVHSGFPGGTAKYQSIRTVLEGLEKRGNIGRPVVIVLIGDANTIGRFTRRFLDAMDLVLGMVGPYIKGADALSAISDAQKVSAAIRKLVDGQQLSADSIANDLLPIVSSLLPPEAGRYLDDARAIYSDISRGNLNSAAQRLGVDVSSLGVKASALFEGTGIPTIINDATRTARKTFDDVRGVVQGVQLFDAVNGARVFAQSRGSIEATLGQYYNHVLEIPAVRDVFALGATTGLLPTIPNFTYVAGDLLRMAEDAALSIADLERPGALDISASLSLAGIGVATNPEALRTIAYEALRNGVNAARDAMTEKGKRLASYVLPFAFGTDKHERACVADQLRRDTGVDILIDPLVKRTSAYASNWPPLGTLHASTGSSTAARSATTRATVDPASSSLDASRIAAQSNVGIQATLRR